jgi:hypothetical protein
MRPGLLPRLDPGLGPHFGVGLLVAGDLDVPGRVAVQHTLFDGEVERRAQVLHRRRGLRATFAVTGAGNGREHGTQQAGVEVREAVPAEARDEDGIDVARVVEPGCRPDVGAGVEPVP